MSCNANPAHFSISVLFINKTNLPDFHPHIGPTSEELGLMMGPVRRWG